MVSMTFKIRWTPETGDLHLRNALRRLAFALYGGDAVFYEPGGSPDHWWLGLDKEWLVVAVRGSMEVRLVVDYNGHDQGDVPDNLAKVVGWLADLEVLE